MDINLIVDLVIVLIVIIGIILGVKRGFVATVAKPVRIIAALGVAFGLCQPAGEEYVKPIIKKPLVEKMTAMIEEKCGELTAENASSDIPAVLKLLANLFKVDVDTVAEQATSSIVNAVVDALADPVVTLAGTVIAFVVLFFVTSIVCWFIFKIIELIFHFGPLESLNKIFGLVFGAAFSLILVWALSVGLDYIVNHGFLSDVEYLKDFTGGTLYQVIKKLNPIDLIFKI